MTVNIMGNGKVQIQIGKGVRFRNLPQEAVEKLFNDLTFENQQYKNALKHGGYIATNIPQYFKYFAVSSNREVIWTPRGYIWIMKKWCLDNGYDVEIYDNTLRLPEINVEFQGKLRDYQQPSVDNVVRRYPIGILEAATGAGKTCMATAVIARRKQPTLVIVHTKELLYQWQGAIKKFLDYDCGLIGDGKCDVKDITVGIINTVRNKLDELTPRFGHVIIDEVHRVASNIFSETLTEFPARYYLGLTATPYRRDGLGGAIYVHIGPKVHTVDKKQLQDDGQVLKPEIILVKTNFRAGRSFIDEDAMNYSQIIKKLTTDSDRNEIIVRTIHKDLNEHRDNILIVSDRVSHIKKLSYLLKSINIDSRVLSGSEAGKPKLFDMFKYDEEGNIIIDENNNPVTYQEWGIQKMKRKEIVAEMRSGKCKVVLATLSLIGEGFDLDSLTVLCLTTPIKFKGRLVQTVGRILRPKDGKVPRLYDFRDENVQVLKYSGYARNKIYKQEWGQ
jgi:superfamily II DNA or RNA helicase